MKEIWRHSLIVRGLTAAAGWIDRQWQKSFLALALTGSGVSGEGSLVGKIGHGFHRALWAVFHALRLDRLSEGSIFTKEFFWLGTAVALAPLLPTMAVLVLALAAMGSVVLGYARDRERRAARTPLNKWVIGFAIIYLAATLFSVTPAESLKGGLLVTVFALFALVVPDVCRDEGRCRRLAAIIAVSGTAVAVIGIGQAVLGLESTIEWVDLGDFDNLTLRVYSTLDNPNVLSEYLMLATPMAAACAVSAKNANARAAALAAVGSMLLCLILTWSRGGWLGIAVGTMVFLVVLDRRFAVLGIAGILALLPLLPHDILLRITSIGSMSDSSTAYRVYIWLATAEMLKTYWMFGIGTGMAAFQSIYPRYSFNAVSAPHAHSLYLQVLCECGVPGIAALLGALVSAVRGLCGAVRRSGTGAARRAYPAAALAALAAFAVQSATDYSFYNYRVTLMFWVTAGLAAAIGLCWGREEAQG